MRLGSRSRKGKGADTKRRSRATTPATSAVPSSKPDDAETLRDFTPRETLFIDARVQGINATKAAEIAGYSEPRKAGYRLGTNVHIAAEIRRRVGERSDRLDIQVDDLVLEHVMVSRADPNELVQVRRNCCRHCYGKDHGYQMTQRELDARRSDYDRQVEAAQKAWERRKNAKASDQPPMFPAFDEMGGAGFDKRRAPSGQCPECFGDGIEEMLIADTRTLSRAGRALWRGVKRSKDGTVSVMFADQHAARIEAGKLLGHYAGKGEDAGPSLEDLIAAAYTATQKSKAP